MLKMDVMTQAMANCSSSMDEYCKKRQKGMSAR